MSARTKCQRILAHVKRDPMETTPVTIFIHEFPILQVIHGPDGVSLVPNTEHVLAQSTEAVGEQVALEFKEQGKPTSGEAFDRVVQERRRELVAAMIAPGEVEPDQEYARLVERYGRHVDVPVSNVEYVYGRPNSRTWRDALKMKVSDLDVEGATEPEMSETAANVRRGQADSAAEGRKGRAAA